MVSRCVGGSSTRHSTANSAALQSDTCNTNNTTFAPAFAPHRTAAETQASAAPPRQLKGPGSTSTNPSTVYSTAAAAAAAYCHLHLQHRRRRNKASKQRIPVPSATSRSVQRRPGKHRRALKRDEEAPLHPLVPNDRVPTSLMASLHLFPLGSGFPPEACRSQNASAALLERRCCKSSF